MRTEERTSRSRAKQLRGSMTKAEVILWMNLRALRADGYNFRRQHPIGPYIADFAIHAGKLVVEVDGATHGTPDEVAYDRGRDTHLRSKGWHVLRVPNIAVYENIEHVIDSILSRIPPPARRYRGDPPPPQAGEDKYGQNFEGT
jgi:very-short-patch-repair endonuclease